MTDRTHEETLELLAFALGRGAVHVKVGDVELMLPPPIETQPNLVSEDPLSEEGSLKAWIAHRPLPKVAP